MGYGAMCHYCLRYQCICDEPDSAGSNLPGNVKVLIGDTVGLLDALLESGLPNHILTSIRHLQFRWLTVYPELKEEEDYAANHEADEPYNLPF